MSGVTVVLEAPIVYDVPGGVVHSPMVAASVGGMPTRLILDTGASDHLLMLALTDVLGMPRTAAEPGSDHAGASIESFDLGEVATEIAGQAVTLHGAISIEGPAPFAGWGIGGILSAHRLDPHATLVLDLAHDTLLLVTGEDIDDWLRGRYARMRALTLPRVPAETVQTFAAVEPFDPVVVMLDTGSGDTAFARSAVPGLSGAPPVAMGRAVGGDELYGAQVRDQVLRFGDDTFPIAVMSIEEQPPREHGEGLIGMDVLRGTVLAVSPDVSQPICLLRR